MIHKKFNLFGRFIPAWVLAGLLILAASGAATGTVLAGQVTGDLNVTISQSLLVGDVDTRTKTGSSAGAYDAVTDDETAFSSGIELLQGDCYYVGLFLENASDFDLTGDMMLDLPEGVTADAVVSGFSEIAFDILSGPPAGDNHTALGLSMHSVLGRETVRVDVYDKENNLVGRIANVSAPVDGGGFLGIVAVEGNTIGRVNIFDPGNGGEGVYDVAAYFINPCPWDISGDGNVGAADLLGLLIAWGPNKGHPADFDGDGFVGASDLLALLVNWGPCP